jgi:hypothetical protein
MDMNKIYYVYVHYTCDTKELFYVGKGKEERAYSRRSRNNMWKNISSKHGYSVEFIENNLNEEEALKLEIELISLHKPRANLTNGGQGTSGYKHSPETVKKRNENNKRINSTPEGKLKKSLAQKEAQNRPEVKEKIRLKRVKLMERVRNGEIENPFKGKKWTPDQIEAISSKQRGKNGYWYGKTTTVALRVINLDTNQVFQSLTEAAASVNGVRQALAKALRSGRKFKKVNFAWYKE